MQYRDINDILLVLFEQGWIRPWINCRIVVCSIIVLLVIKIRISLELSFNCFPNNIKHLRNGLWRIQEHCQFLPLIFIIGYRFSGYHSLIELFIGIYTFVFIISCIIYLLGDKIVIVTFNDLIYEYRGSVMLDFDCSGASDFFYFSEINIFLTNFQASKEKLDQSPRGAVIFIISNFYLGFLDFFCKNTQTAI